MRVKESLSQHGILFCKVTCISGRVHYSQNLPVDKTFFAVI